MGEVQGVGGLVLDVAVDFSQGRAAVVGRLAAVFILGSHPGLAVGEGGHFDADFSELGIHCLVPSGKGVTLDFSAAHTEGGALVKEKVFQVAGE